jgi:hypothetical protein
MGSQEWRKKAESVSQESVEGVSERRDCSLATVKDVLGSHRKLVYRDSYGDAAGARNRGLTNAAGTGCNGRIDETPR